MKLFRYDECLAPGAGWTWCAPADCEDFLASFEPRDRRILELRFFESLTYLELADVFKVTSQCMEKRVSTLLRRGRHPSRLKLLDPDEADLLEIMRLAEEAVLYPPQGKAYQPPPNRLDVIAVSPPLGPWPAHFDYHYPDPPANIVEHFSKHDLNTNPLERPNVYAILEKL